MRSGGAATAPLHPGSTAQLQALAACSHPASVLLPLTGGPSARAATAYLVPSRFPQ